MRLQVVVFAAVAFLVGCSGTPPPVSSPTAVPTATTTATQQQSATPAASGASPTASPRPLPTTSIYDGIWATPALTKADLAAALVRASLDVGVLDDWRDDWDEIDHWVFEFVIGDGEWRQDEIGDGLAMSGWVGGFSGTNEPTVVLTDEECSITYQVTLSEESMAVDVTDSDCPADDIALQTAMVEAAPFELVEPPGWTPPEVSSEPTSPPTLGTSTSSDRLTWHPIGSVDGAPLGYAEYLPPSYAANGAKSPVLVFLHGSGESGDGTEFQLLRLVGSGIPGMIYGNRWPDERPFVVLSPQHREDAPNFCMEATEIDQFLRFALDHYNVDPSRLYVTGLSCGAIGLWNYLAQHGDELIAAAVPIAGFGLAAFSEQGCELGKTPIWAFHGALDGNVPVHGDVYPLTSLQGCSDPAPVDARLTVYPLTGHDSWTQTYERSAEDDIYDWMLSHTR